MCEFCAMRVQVSRDDVRREFVQLVRTYPKAVPVLRDAFAGGHIIGSTYSDPWTGSRCVLGWTAFIYPQAFIIGSPYYHTMEYFVQLVRPGETPETSSELAFLLSVLDEEATHPLPKGSITEAVSTAPLQAAVARVGFDELISNAQRAYTTAVRPVPVVLPWAGTAVVWDELIGTTQLTVTRRAVSVSTPDGEAIREERELVAT